MNADSFSILLGIAIYGDLPPIQPHQQDVDPFSFLLGIAVAVVVGFLAFQFGVWLGKYKMGQKQVVKHTTDKTPLQIVANAVFRAIAGIVAVALSVAVLLYLPIEESLRLTLFAIFAVFIIVSLLISRQ